MGNGDGYSVVGKAGSEEVCYGMVRFNLGGVIYPFWIFVWV